MSDADAEYIAQWDRARAMNYQGLYDDPPDEVEPEEENRAQRRARDRADARAKAIPAKEKMKRPTYAEMLARLIVDWDLTYGKDANGDDIDWPVTLKNIEMIDYAIRLDMMTSIMDDFVNRPNLTSLSKRYSAATTANGASLQISASEPSSGVVASSPGIS